jgi:hypothetical protein
MNVASKSTKYIHHYTIQYNTNTINKYLSYYGTEITNSQLLHYTHIHTYTHKKNVDTRAVNSRNENTDHTGGTKEVNRKSFVTPNLSICAARLYVYFPPHEAVCM